MGILFDRERIIWVLRSGGMAYSLGVDPGGNLQHLYWGEDLPLIEDYPSALLPKEYGFDGPLQRINEEYPPWGGMRFKEGALKVTYPQGERDLALSYSNYQLEEDLLIITLEDPVFGLIVDLYYQLCTPLPILKRWSQIKNETGGEVLLQQAFSGVLHFPSSKEYRLHYLSGGWVEETRLTKRILSPGKMVLESRRGSVGHRLNPSFAIDDGRSQREWGRVYYGALAYSGSFRLSFDLEEGLQLMVGMNDFDSTLVLEERDTFTTPPLICGLSQGGFDAMSHDLHQYQQSTISWNERRRPLPVIYNSWEVEGFHVTQERQMELAKRAKELGVEIFVLDDGWFYRRDSDRRGLGDWSVDERKFPEGLEPLIAQVRGLGMGFGLWVEPEMVNPDSLLFANHPHWVYHFPSRSSSLYRNQLLLNLGLKEVQSFIQKTLDTLMERYQLDFLKWDMNRHFSEPGALDLPLKRQQEVWYRHIDGLYRILESLREKYPHLIIEACSGGGGRVDLGILPYVDQFWVSDNTDPYDRLLIQEGFSTFYAPSTMGSWVTDSPNWLTKRSTPLNYRFHVAMMGALGVGGNLLEWSPREISTARENIGKYKEIRGLIASGLQYHLHSLDEGPLVAVEYLSLDRKRGVVFLFLQGQGFGRTSFRVKLRGLKDSWLYSTDKGERRSGKAFKEIGLQVSLDGEYGSSLLSFKVVGEGGS